jgi:hypothetical protein
MNQIPVDLGVLLRPASSSTFEAVVERLTKDSIPRFFSVVQPGGSVSYSEVLLAVLCTPGVRRARLIRLSRTADAGGVPPEKLEFSPEEVPVLGRLEIDIDPEPSQPPFALS